MTSAYINTSINLPQISYEKLDCLKLQEKFFREMTVEDIYKKARTYIRKKSAK